MAINLTRRLGDVLRRPFGTWRHETTGELTTTRIPIADFQMDAPLEERLAPSSPGAEWIPVSAAQQWIVERGTGEGPAEAGDYAFNGANMLLIMPEGAEPDLANAIEVDTRTVTVSEVDQIIYTGTAENSQPGTLRDNQGGWTTDEHVDMVCEALSGTGAGQERYIKSNIANRLAVAPDWDEPRPGAGTGFQIRDTPLLSIVENIADSEGNAYSVTNGVMAAV